MYRAGLAKLLVVGVVVLGLSVAATHVYAGCHHRHACGTDCCGGCDLGWGGDFSYGAGCGCCGTCGGLASGYGRAAGYMGAPATSGCCGGHSGGGLYSAPLAPVNGPATMPNGVPTAVPTTTVPVLPGRTSGEPANADSGSLTVWVPEEATVTINGLPTKMTGNVRHFFSRDLTPGKPYHYQVQAEIVRNGKTLTDVQTVTLVAGERGSVAFHFNAMDAEGLAAAK